MTEPTETVIERLRAFAHWKRAAGEELDGMVEDMLRLADEVEKLVQNEIRDELKIGAREIEIEAYKNVLKETREQHDVLRNALQGMLDDINKIEELGSVSSIGMAKQYIRVWKIFIENAFEQLEAEETKEER